MTPEQAWAAGHKRLFITGIQQAGKTTWCTALIAHARAQNVVVRGLLSPAVFVEGEKIGIDLLNLTTNERRRLAERRQPEDTTGILTQCWRFHPEVLDWGEMVLRQIESTDLLLIDEIGVMELEQGSGWQSALTLLDAGNYRTACVVVRPSLLELVLDRWGGHVVEIT